MADEARIDLHHGASRCLLGLIDAAAGGLADWSEFDAEAERWGIEVRGLYPRDPYAKGDLPEPLPRLHGTAGTSICEDGKTGEVGFVGRSEVRLRLPPARGRDRERYCSHKGPHDQT